MADEDIKTSIDDLVLYLNNKGETNITSLSSALGVGEVTVIGWANILEKANMVKITYKAGKMYLSPLNVTKENVEVLKQMEQSEKLNVSAEAASMLSIVKQVTAKIDNYNKSLNEIDSIFKNNYKELRGLLDNVNSVEGKMNDASKRIKDRKAEVDSLDAKVRQDMASMEKLTASTNKLNVDTSNARAVSQELAAMINAYKASVAKFNKDMLGMMEEHRKNAAKSELEMEAKVKKSEEINKANDKQIEEYERQARTYNREAEARKLRFQKEELRIIDDIAKRKDEIARYAKLSESQLLAAQDRFASVKTEMGGIVELNEKLNRVHAQIAEVSKEKDNLTREINDIINEIKALEGISKTKVFEQKTAMDRLGKKVKVAQGDVDKLNQQMGQFDVDVNDLGK